MIENLPSYQASFDDFAFHFKLLGNFCRDSNKQRSVHIQRQRLKTGEQHGHPLDVSVHHDKDVNANDDHTKDSSVSKRLRLIAKKLLEGKKKNSECHPLDVSVHIPRAETIASQNRTSHFQNELKKGMDLSSLEIADGSHSFKKSKRIRMQVL